MINTEIVEKISSDRTEDIQDALIAIISSSKSFEEEEISLLQAVVEPHLQTENPTLKTLSLKAINRLKLASESSQEPFNTTQGIKAYVDEWIKCRNETLNSARIFFKKAFALLRISYLIAQALLKEYFTRFRDFSLKTFAGCHDIYFGYFQWVFNNLLFCQNL